MSLSWAKVPDPLIFPFSESLHVALQPAFEDYEIQTMSRRKKDEWKQKWATHLCADPITKDAIVEWVGQCIGVTPNEQAVSYSQASNVFLNVALLLQFSIVSSEEREAAVHQELILFQTLLIDHVTRRTNIVLDGSYTRFHPYSLKDSGKRPDDGHLTDEDYSDDDDDDDYIEPMDVERFHDQDIVMDDIAEENNLKTTRTKNTVALEQYVDTCQTWEATLSSIFLGPKGASEAHDPDDISFHEAQTQVADVMQAMKAVQKHVYTSQDWQQALVISKLADTINIICDPAYMWKYTRQHCREIQRYNVIQIFLGFQLDTWTAEETITEWDKCGDAEEYEPDQNGGRFMRDGKDLLNAFTTDEKLLPKEAHPQVVFFLLSEGTFQGAARKWLKAALDTRKYNLKTWDTKTMYRSVQNQLRQWRKLNQLEAKKMPETLRLILKRTLQFWEMKNELETKVFGHRDHTALIAGLKRGECVRCRTLDPAQQCVQEIVVKLNEGKEFVENLTGVGISKVPLDELMTPLPPPKDRATKTKAEVLHPDVLKLRCISSDPTIKARCNRHIVKIVMEPGGPLIDFVEFNAFSQERLDMLNKHHDTASGVSAISRHGGFDRWALNDKHSKMVPLGSRLASGGIRGDGYTAYKGMSANNCESIDLLFNHAEDSFALLETARAIDPTLVRQIMQESKECDRLGISGTTLYRCNNYMAPQHPDRDGPRGLCSQLKWDAKREYDEFSFCQPQFGYYIRTEANMIWSFDSRYLHGTMLPSKETVFRIRGGAQASTGDHQAVRTRDRDRAQRDARVRGRYNLRRSHWNEQRRLHEARN